jgi:tetratricopeptide (TPR) repeat protein
MADTVRAPRRHGIQPAPLQRPVFEVLALKEDALASALWQAIRNVLIWARTPADNRATLFHALPPHARERYAAARAFAPDLCSALDTLERQQSAAAELEPRDVAVACHRVYQWADARGLLAVATHFAEAAAYADPDAPLWALDAGMVCRKAGGPEMMVRSGAWYRRARTLAVRTGDAGAMLRSLTGYGAVLKESGDKEGAQLWYTYAARKARRMGQKRGAAVAHHYSFALAAESGDTATAIDHAARALRLYPVNDERVPFLLADFGFLLVQLHYYRTAYGLLDRAAARMDPPALCLMFSTAARAAGGAGWAERYDYAARAVLRMIGSSEEYAAPALVNLAEGARSLGQWSQAESYLRRAFAVGERLAHDEAIRVGREVLEAVERRDRGAPVETPSPNHPAAVLARSMVARMRRWRRHPRRRRG